MLLSGEAESIGSKTAKFHAQISRENALLSETISISSQRDAIIRIGYVLADSKMPASAGSDMRRLHEAASANADARLAIQMFCYSVRKQVAAMIAALDGVDVIVFTGGIGKNDGEALAAICGGLSWIGVRLDAGRNRFANNPINDPASRCSVLVLASREDEQIAPHTWALFPRSLS
jgi:acetate kinase